jgi:hypothetical protein
MKKEWTDYLSQIGITGSFLPRGIAAIEFYEQIGLEISDIFVSEYLDKEGVRRFEGLWIFTGDKICEAEEFLTKDDFDGAQLKGKVRYWNLTKSEYDFIKATSKSQLTIDCSTYSELACTLKASQQNCDKLRDIFKKYIVSNLG